MPSSEAALQPSWVTAVSVSVAATAALISRRGVQQLLGLVELIGATLMHLLLKLASQNLADCFMAAVDCRGSHSNVPAKSNKVLRHAGGVGFTFA
jgi:hypothetical protein